MRFLYSQSLAVAVLGTLTYVSCMTSSGAANPTPDLIYIGTYTGEKSQGIYRAAFDSRTGKLGVPELAAKTTSPTFLALHPRKRVLYAVGESSRIGPKREGAVSAFAIKDGGELELLNQQPSGGSGPCHLSVDESGKCVLVANYGSGSVAAFPVVEDGRLGLAGSVIQHEGASVNPRRQAGPHAHHIIPDPASRYVLACDLGLDKVLVYRFNAAAASLSPNAPPSASVPPGAGPRHLVFHPNGAIVYVVNEMGSSVTTFAYDAKRGALDDLGTVSTLPAGFTGQNSCAEIEVHPSGKFLYASNRGHNSVAVYSIAKGGKISLIDHTATGGNTPRHFAIDPSAKWLLAENQDSDNIFVFQIDTETGRLTPTGDSIEVGKPVCIVFGNK